MSLEIINKFQNQIYQKLMDNNEINTSIKKIYFSAVQDGKCPFLLINIKKIQDLLAQRKQVYSIDFEISIYAKDHNHQSLLSIADKIESILSGAEISFDKFKTAGLQSGEIFFEKAKDLVLNRLVIQYKSLIKREDYD